MADLEELCLRSCPQLTPEAPNHLQHCKNLRKLSLVQCGRVEGGIAYLSRLPNLKVLWLDLPAMDTALKGIGGLKGLEVLTVANTGAANPDLEHIGRLTQLQSLDLSGTKITDEGLNRLRSLTKLRKLNLSHTQVTSDGLVHLQTLRSLETLNLEGTSVDDRGVDALKGLPNLEEVSIVDCKVTLGGRQRLKEILPNIILVN
jgi:Leucine-rich repeat (LRR) protein